MLFESMAPPELVVVLPVYNEEASVRKVVLEWFHEIENWTEDFLFLVIDDGSTDGTRDRLSRLQLNLGTRLRVISQKNAGHGQTCIHGYQAACDLGAKWVFQIDSDGQCDPQYFFRFWRDRDGCDVIYGNRVYREDGFKRVIASAILRFVLLAWARVWCIDANVPYRLMRCQSIRSVIPLVPPSFHLANVALAVLLRRRVGIREGRVNIRFRDRYGGEPSVRFASFGARARQLINNLSELPPA